MNPKSNHKFQMLGLPSDLHREILLRLPGSSLFRFRAVCKSWCHEIDDPSFVRDHTVNNHRTSTSNLLLTTPSAVYSLPVDSLSYVDGQKTISATRVQSALLRPGRFATSCNGLVLIPHNDSTSIWVVWNPLTGDYLELPLTGLEVNQFVGCGIGYDPSSDDYKVVCVDEDRGLTSTASDLIKKSVYRTHIYSLRSNSWKRIEEDCPSLLLCSSQATLVNGALYWVVEDSVVALDLATERFRKLPLPYSGMSCILGFEVLGGCLVVVRNEDMCTAWVLKDYEWVGLFTPVVLSLIKDEKRLVLPCGRLIIHWDVQTRSQKVMRIEKLVKIGDPLYTHIVEESIFRFGRRNMAAGVKRKRSEADERSACVEKIQVLFCERDSSFW